MRSDKAGPTRAVGVMCWRLVCSSRTLLQKTLLFGVLKMDIKQKVGLMLRLVQFLLKEEFFGQISSLCSDDDCKTNFMEQQDNAQPH